MANLSILLISIFLTTTAFSQTQLDRLVSMHPNLKNNLKRTLASLLEYDQKNIPKRYSLQQLEKAKSFNELKEELYKLDPTDAEQLKIVNKRMEEYGSLEIQKPAYDEAKTAKILYPDLNTNLGCLIFWRFLGKGAQGVVSLARSEKGQFWAVKRLFYPTFEKYEKYRQGLQTIKDRIKKHSPTPFNIRIVNFEVYNSAKNWMIYDSTNRLPLSSALGNESKLTLIEKKALISLLQISSTYFSAIGINNKFMIKTSNVLIDINTLELIVHDPE